MPPISLHDRQIIAAYFSKTRLSTASGPSDTVETASATPDDRLFDPCPAHPGACHLFSDAFAAAATGPWAVAPHSALRAALQTDGQWTVAQQTYRTAREAGDAPGAATAFTTMLELVTRAARIAERRAAIRDAAETPAAVGMRADDWRAMRTRVTRHLEKEQAEALRWIETALGSELASYELALMGDHMEDLGLRAEARGHFERAGHQATTVAEKSLMDLRAIQQMPLHEQTARRAAVEAIRRAIPDLLQAAQRWEQHLAQQPSEPTILLPDELDGLPFDQIPFDSYPTVVVDTQTFVAEWARSIPAFDPTRMEDAELPQPIIVLYEGRESLPSPPPGSVAQVRLLYPLAWQVAYTIEPTAALEAERRQIVSQLLGLSAIARYPVSTTAEETSDRAMLPDLSIGAPTVAELLLHLENARLYGQRWTTHNGQLEQLLATEGTEGARGRYDQTLLPDLLDAAQLATLAPSEPQLLHEVRGELLGLAYDDGLSALDLPRERLRGLAELATAADAPASVKRRIARLREHAPWAFTSDGQMNPDVDMTDTEQGQLAAAETRARYLTSQDLLQEGGLPIGGALLGGALGLFCGPVAWLCVPAGGALGGGGGKIASTAMNLHEHDEEIAQSAATGLAQLGSEEAEAHRTSWRLDLGLNIAFGVIAGPGGRAAASVGTTAMRGLGATVAACGRRTVAAIRNGSFRTAAASAVMAVRAATAPSNWPRSAQWLWARIQTPRLSATDRFFISGTLVAADYGGFLGEAGKLDHWAGYAGLGFAGINPMTLRMAHRALQPTAWRSVARYFTGAADVTASAEIGLQRAFQRVFSIPADGPVPAELLEGKPWVQQLAAHYRLYRIDLAGTTPQMVRVGAWDAVKSIGATTLTDGERIGAACFLADLAQQKEGAPLPQLTMGGALCFMLAANRVAIRHFNIDRAGTWTMFFIDRGIDAINQVTSGRSPWNIDAYRVAMNYVSGGVVSLVRGRYVRNLLARNDPGIVKTITIKTGPAYSETIALKDATIEERALAAKLLRSSTMADNALTFNAATGAIGRNGLNGHRFTPTATLTEAEQGIFARWLQPGVTNPAPLSTIMEAQAIVGRTVAGHRSDLLYLQGSAKQAAIQRLLRTESTLLLATGAPAHQQAAATWLLAQLGHLEKKTNGAQLARWLGPHLERSVAASQVGLNGHGHIGLKLNVDLTAGGVAAFSSLHDTILGGGWDYARAIYLLHGDPMHMMQWAWLRGFTTLPARNYFRLRHAWDTNTAWYGDRVLKWVGDPLAAKFVPHFSNQGFWKQQYTQATGADSLQSFLDFHVAPMPWQGGLDAYNWTTPLAALGLDTDTSPYSPIGEGYQDLAEFYAAKTTELSAHDWENADRFVDTLLTEAKRIAQTEEAIGRRATDYDDRTLREHAMAIGLAAWYGHTVDATRFVQTARNHADLFRIFSSTVPEATALEKFPDLVEDRSLRFAPWE